MDESKYGSQSSKHKACEIPSKSPLKEVSVVLRKLDYPHVKLGKNDGETNIFLQNHTGMEQVKSESNKVLVKNTPSAESKTTSTSSKGKEIVKRRQKNEKNDTQDKRNSESMKTPTCDFSRNHRDKDIELEESPIMTHGKNSHCRTFKRAASSAMIPTEIYSSALNIHKIGIPKQQSEIKETSKHETTLGRTSNLPNANLIGYKLSDLRLGLGYNMKLSQPGVCSSASVLDSLAIQGNRMNDSQSNSTDNTGIETSSPTINESVDQNPTKRQRTIPTILAKSRSRVAAPTVKELLQRQKSDTSAIPLQTSTSTYNKGGYSEGDVPCISTGKSLLLPTTIPPKHATTEISLNGMQMENSINPTTISDYSLSSTISAKDLKTKRYKNTRYTIPYKGPSIIIPKHFDPNLVDFDSVQTSTIQNSASFLLPKLTDSNTVSNTYKKTGKLTSLPSMAIGSVGSLSMSTIPLTSQSIETSQRSRGVTPTKASPRSKSSSPIKYSFLRISTPDSIIDDKLPDLKVHGKASFVKDNEHEKGTENSKASEKVTKIKKNEFTCLKDYHRFILGSSPSISSSQNKHSSLGIYKHPLIGKFSEMVAKQHGLMTSFGHDTELSSPVPSNSTVNTRIISASPNISKSDCFYCEVEQIVSNGQLEKDINPDSAKASDHAYTTTSNSSPVKTIPSFDVQNTRENSPAITLYNTRRDSPSSDLQKLWERGGGSQIPVYAIRCGKQLLLVPSSLPSEDPMTPSTTPDLRFSKTTKRSKVKRAKNCKGNKRVKKCVGKKSKRGLTTLSPTKLEFAKLVDLEPLVVRKTKKTNLECVIAKLQKLKRGGANPDSLIQRQVAKIIQIERSIDDIFTQIINMVDIEFHFGNDPLLKRWHEYEDYSVRLVYDHVSGAIKRIETDSLKPGFYKIIKTGTLPSNSPDRKTLATMQPTLPSTQCILNDNLFIAVGKIFPNSNNDINKWPANIQKHSNVEYVLRSVFSLGISNNEMDYTSDRSYLPKIHSPKWYSKNLFDRFTEGKFVSQFEKTDK